MEAALNQNDMSRGDDASSGMAIILGYGRIGTVYGKLFDLHRQSWRAVEIVSEVVARAARGPQVIEGDGLQIELLERAGLAKASSLVLTIKNSARARPMIKELRSRYPELAIITRARTRGHAEKLYEAGATSVSMNMPKWAAQWKF
jgi:monovalent cation:H+ antiporter-2, CPA2 family